MAKKKRKRHRNPVAPPVHSAPEAVQRPQTFAAGPDAPPARPVGTEPPTAAGPPAPGGPVGPAPTKPAAPRSRPATRPTGQRRRRRGRLRTYLWIGLVIVAVVGAFVARSILNGREVRAFDALATANGCGALQSTGTSGGNVHFSPPEKTKYDTSPPTHGPHEGGGTIHAGVYDEPFVEESGVDNSIYRAVHSLEHGAVIIWNDGLKKDALEDLERRYRNEVKVIVVPYPQLSGDTHVVLTSWGHRVDCEAPSDRVIDRYIEIFRAKPPAPEPNNAI